MSIVEIAPVSALDKDKAIANAVAGISKKYGKGTLLKMGDREIVPVDVISTGIYNLDYEALGVGGLPRGRIIEVFGPESSGKTTIALTVIASAQRGGGHAAFIDAEHALDPTWATKMDVDVPNLYISQPDNGEQALDVVQDLVDTRSFDVIVVDSVAALVPKAELEGEMGDSHMGVQARLMSQAMRKLTGRVSRSDTVLIFINQIREKIGVMFGSPETTTGGRALKFYSSVRLDIRRIGAVKEGEVIVGNKTRIKVVKNKVAAPFREAEVELLFNQGFNRIGSLLTPATAKGVVEKNGSWFSYKGERIGQGFSNACDFIAEHDMFNAILADLVALREKE